MNIAMFRVKEQKCATCRFWQGYREVEFRGRELFYVKAEAKPAPCMATKAQKTPNGTCFRFAAWEKL